MASFSAGTTFTDGVANDVTAAKLAALVNNATPTSGLIQDRTAETITATNDTLLIGDASDSNNLKRITVANFAQTLPTAKITTGTIATGTFGTTTSTAATITSGTIPTLTAGTTTGTAASFSGDLTIADKIVHSGDTNTAIRFPSADTVTVETSGTEAMRINASGSLLIGTTSDTSGGVIKLRISDGTIDSAYGYKTGGVEYVGTITNHPIAVLTNNAERLRIDSSGDVGIGTTSPSQKLTVSSDDVLGGVLVTGSNAPAIRLNDTTNGTTYSAIYAQNDGVMAVSADESNSASNSFLSLRVDATERLRIDSDGDVSIGTATALSKLHVHGNITLSNTTTATSAGTSTITPPATVAGYLTVSINGTSRKIPYYAT